MWGSGAAFGLCCGGGLGRGEEAQGLRAPAAPSARKRILAKERGGGRRVHVSVCGGGGGGQGLRAPATPSARKRILVRKGGRAGGGARQIHGWGVKIGDGRGGEAREKYSHALIRHYTASAVHISRLRVYNRSPPLTPASSVPPAPASYPRTCFGARYSYRCHL